MHPAPPPLTVPLAMSNHSYARSTEHSSAAPLPSDQPIVVIELELARLLDCTNITCAKPNRRLNAFENVTRRMVRARGHEVAPSGWPEMLRMTPMTLRAHTQWIGQPDRDDVDALRRIDAYFYRGVRDRTVREGWVRVLVT